MCRHVPILALKFLVALTLLAATACTDKLSSPSTVPSTVDDTTVGNNTVDETTVPDSTVPPTVPESRLYLDQQSSIEPIVTPQDKPVIWGHAPNIDENYGGTLYQGTTIAIADPRPALEDGNQPLRMWIAEPDNQLKDRPAILWFHGGGFAVGVDSMFKGLNQYGVEYAKRGYVSVSVEYRIDTTLEGGELPGSNRPRSLCQWVQKNLDGADPDWGTKKDRCLRNVEAASHDALAAARFVRTHADRFGVDPNKVVIGGFSAGAVMASNTAYQWDDVGTVKYFEEDTVSSEDSRPNAVIGASGCTYAPDLGVPTTIDSSDAPLSFIASELDRPVPYSCVRTTVDEARSKGLVAELASYCGEAGHATKLYREHLGATDSQWTNFMVRELGIYSDIEPYVPTPTCEPKR